MSFDTADDLHAAEDEIGRLQHILDHIHALLCHPFEWDSGTVEGVWEILEAEGYRMVADNEFDQDSEQPVEAFKPWRPIGHCWRLTCQPGEDDTCGCPCHEED